MESAKFEAARNRVLQTFGAAVQRRRQKVGLTQVGLAVRCGVSPSTIAAIEGERAAPSFWLIVALSRALNVEVSQLFKST